MTANDNGTEDRDIPADSRSDRDERGLFLPGNSIAKLGGRPRGIDFRKLVQEFRKAALDGDLQQVYESMLDRAKAGDVQAAKLLLDRLCDIDPQEVNVNHSGAIDGTAAEPTGEARAEWLRRFSAMAREELDAGSDSDR